jgi:hypothetical protein
MPQKEQKLNVNIKTKPNNKQDCDVPDFVAKPGSTVVFQFDEFPGARIVFNGNSSPFAAPEFNVGPHRVRDNAAQGQVRFKVTWVGGGSGNGTGEVIPVG